MRVIALDPGSVKVGWAVLEGKLPIRVLDYGVFTPSADGKFNAKMNDEMQQCMKHFLDLFEKYEPEAAVWEIVPNFGRMGQRERVVAASAVFKTLAWERHCKWTEYTPRAVKKRFTGNASAEKSDMREHVFKWYPEFPVIDNLPPDAYDAIALASVAIVDGEWKGGSGPVCR